MNIQLEKYGVVNLVNYTDLTEEESQLVLAMRNHPEIMKWMYHSDEILLSEHHNFIEGLKKDSSRYYFLVKQNDLILGSINFLDLKNINHEVVFGLYANPYVSIAGIGRILEEASIFYASNKLQAKVLKLEVYSENKQVMNLHKKYGFNISGRKEVNDKEVLCMQKNYIEQESV